MTQEELRMLQEEEEQRQADKNTLIATGAVGAGAKTYDIFKKAKQDGSKLSEALANDVTEKAYKAKKAGETLAKGGKKTASRYKALRRKGANVPVAAAGSLQKGAARVGKVLGKNVAAGLNNSEFGKAFNEATAASKKHVKLNKKLKKEGDKAANEFEKKFTERAAKKGKEVDPKKMLKNKARVSKKAMKKSATNKLAKAAGKTALKATGKTALKAVPYVGGALMVADTIGAAGRLLSGKSDLKKRQEEEERRLREGY